MNFDLNKAGELEKLQIFELVKIRNEAYENAKITKSRTKFFLDQCIHKMNFVPEKKVLLYNSRLHIFTGNLRHVGPGPSLCAPSFHMVLW